VSRKSWWELLIQKQEIETKPWGYIPPSERYKRPDPIFDTPSVEAPTIETPAISLIRGRTRGISAMDIQGVPEPKEKEEFIPSIPEGWYEESKLIDTIQTFNSSLLHVGYMSKQFFHDMGTKLINQPVTSDVIVGGRYGIKKIIPMDVANQRRAENIQAGQEAYEKTKKGYEKWLLDHPEYVPRLEYQGSFIENIKKNPMMLLDLGYMSNIAAESLAFSLGTMTITAAATAASGGNLFVGGLAMFMTMYPQEAQGLFETLKEHGFTEEEALKASTWSAALITAIEASEDVYLLTKLVPGLRKPIVASASKAITKTLAKPTVRSWFQAAGTEGFKTVSMETGEEIAQAFTEDVTIRLVDKTHEILPDLAEISGRTFVASLGFGFLAGYQGGIQQYKKNMLNMAIEADRVKNDNPDIKASVSNVLKAVKKAEEQELDTSGTTEQVEQPEITFTGEEIGDTGEQMKIEPTKPELDELLFTEEEQKIYTEKKPLDQLKAEEDKLRETLKTETKSLKEFERQKNAMDSLYKKYVRAERDKLNKERSTPKTEVEAIAFGHVKMRTPETTQTEWKEALGRGQYAYIFRDNPNLSRPDEVASDLQKPMSEDELRAAVVDILKDRPKKYTFEDAESRITDPDISNLKIKVETMEDMISTLEEEILAGEKKIEPTKEQQTTLETLLEKDPRFRKAAENLYDKRVDQLSRTEVETIITQLDKAAKILEKTKGFKRPTFLAKLLTPHIVYSEVLGVKPIVEAAEKGKQEQDIEYRNASNIAGKVISSLGRGVTTIGQRWTAFVRHKPTPIEARMAELLNTYEVAPKDLSEQEAKVFKYLDNLRKTLLRRQNEVRMELGLRPIKGKKAYFKHIIDVMAEAAMLKYGLLETDTTNPVDFRDFPFPEEIIRFIEKKIAGGIYNPASIRRKLGDELTALWSKDLRLVTNAMLWTALKEIHLAKPLKGLVESLDALDTVPGTIPSTTKRWLVDYVNQVIKGQENETDVAINDILNQSGLKGLLDKLLLPYGRRLGPKPLTRVLAGTGRLIIYAVMGPIPRQILRNCFQTVQNIALYGVRATIKGLFPATKQCRELMNESIYYRSYTGLEEIPEGTLSRLGDLWLKGYQMSAIWNAGNSMKAAFHFNMSKINGKYQHTKYSWADKERTADTQEGFLFDSEKEKLLKEMEWGARACQYQYTPIGMPGIFRYKSTVPFTRLQSWWMNYFFNFTREATTRLFKGESGYGMKLPPSERFNYLKYLLIGGIVLNGLGYKKSFLFGVLPMYWSPAAGAAMAVYQYAFAQSDYDRQKAMGRLKRVYQALIPGYLGIKTWNDVLNGNISMEELFFYGKTEKKKKSYITSGAYKSPTERYKRSGYKTPQQRYKR